MGENGCLQRFPAGRPLAADLGEWFVARVKARQEKALARILVEYGISYYLPIACKVHLRPDNGYPKRSWIPLFSGYVAFSGLADRGIVARTHRVHGILNVPDQEGFVRELEAVQQILASGLPCESSPVIPRGSVVRIKTGPLRDICGVLEANNGMRTLIIRIDMFQQSVRTELPAGSVEALDQPASAVQKAGLVSKLSLPF